MTFRCLQNIKKIPKNLEHRNLSSFYPEITRGRVIKVFDGRNICVAARVPQLRNFTIYRFDLILNGAFTPDILSHNPIERGYAIQVRDLVTEKNHE